MTRPYQRKKYHVVSHPNGWAVRKEGAKRANNVYPVKEKAVKRGSQLAEAAGGKLIIHRKDGEVLRERIYGKAPRVTGKPLPGRKGDVLRGDEILPG